MDMRRAMNEDQVRSSLFVVKEDKCLDEVRNVEGHLFDLGRVEDFDLTQHLDVVGGDKVDGNTVKS